MNLLETIVINKKTVEIITSKKIIAREFLYLLCSVVLAGIIYLLLLFIHNRHEKKIEKLNKKAFEMESFEPYLSLIQYTKNAKRLNYDYEKVDSLFPQFVTFNRQSLKDYCATVEERDYNFIELNSKFPEFGFEKDGSHPNFNLLSYKELQKSINRLNSRTRYSMSKVFLILILSIFSFTFILRYLFYAINWSIKQLKREN